MQARATRGGTEGSGVVRRRHDISSATRKAPKKTVPDVFRKLGGIKKHVNKIEEDNKGSRASDNQDGLPSMFLAGAKWGVFFAYALKEKGLQPQANVGPLHWSVSGNEESFWSH